MCLTAPITDSVSAYFVSRYQPLVVEVVERDFGLLYCTNLVESTFECFLLVLEYLVGEQAVVVVLEFYLIFCDIFLDSFQTLSGFLIVKLVGIYFTSNSH